MRGGTFLLFLFLFRMQETCQDLFKPYCHFQRCGDYFWALKVTSDSVLHLILHSYVCVCNMKKKIKDQKEMNIDGFQVMGDDS